MKEYKIYINNSVEEQIYEIAAWYELKSVNLGTEFLNYFDENINEISYNPYSCVIAFDNFRRKFMNKFPYLIFYFVNEEKFEIDILGVYHTSRNPKFIKNSILIK